MLGASKETDMLIPGPNGPSQPIRHNKKARTAFRAVCAFSLIGIVLTQLFRSHLTTESSYLSVGSFYWTENEPNDLCVGMNGKGRSFSGYIGLKGDSDKTPKRSFYWLFEAQNHPENAPIVLTIGGGPGSSGMLNPLTGQSHCKVAPNNITVPNPNAWSENVNLLALDHPIGVGFSYGPMPNNSRTAAYDVWDFLQKFYTAYPQFQKNNFVAAGGSYGGMYIPHIASVIHEKNKAIARGTEQGLHINLEAMMVSNPLSDYLSHHRWLLHQRCYLTDLYNSTTCTELYGLLPRCLESIQFTYENPTLENKNVTNAVCDVLSMGDMNGRAIENPRNECQGPVEECNPELLWAQSFFNSPENKEKLGVPKTLTFAPISYPLHAEFAKTSDWVQQSYLLYEPLLNDGIRLLHYIGKLDCNCAWPGVLSFLKLIHSPFQQAFIEAPDIQWPSSDIATVRAIGPRAGNMTYILMSEAGHFVTKDQPALTKMILDHWVFNEPFV